jgi:hypothetical protein
MLAFVNAIVPLLYCIYLMHSLHHTLMDCCKYLMMKSYLWQMMRTRAFEEPLLDIPESSSCRGCGHGQASCGNAPRPSISLEQLLTTKN